MFTPTMMMIDITYRCTLNCLHCYNSSGVEKSRQELTDGQLIDLFLQAADMCPDTICFCGGETLLRKNVIYEATKKIRQNDTQVNLNIVTNGELIDEIEAERLVNSGLSGIQVSVDGLESSHDWLRQKKGAYHSAVNALTYLVEARRKANSNMLIYVSCTPTPRNLEEIPEVMSICHDLGVDLLRVQPLMILGRARDSFPHQDLLNEKAYRQLHINLSKHSRDIGMRFEWGDPLDHLYMDVEDLTMLTINAFGDIMFTPYIPIAFGNIKNAPLKKYLEHGLADYWDKDPIRFLRDRMVNYDKMDIGTLIGASDLNEGVALIDILNEDHNEQLQRLVDIIKEKTHV